MIITHNILAMNSNRQNGIVRGAMTKSIEKLSSGYKINRAADDAAGLAISEKMRRQIRGLTQGVANAEDGISLCQVADGALDEVTDMLHRMTELAVKSANGTNSYSDRVAMQNEVDAIIKEIDRISETTKFNEIVLFKGPSTISYYDGKPTTDSKFFQLLGNNVSNTGYMNEPLTKSMVMKSTSDLQDDIVTPSANPYVSVHMDFGAVEDKLQEFSGTYFYVNCCTDCCAATVKFNDESVITVDNSNNIINIGLKKNDGSYYDNASDFCEYIVDGLKPLLDAGINHIEFAFKDSMLYMYDVDNNSWSPDQKESAYFCDYEPFIGMEVHPQDKNVYIQTGADAGDGIYLKIPPMDSAILGLSSRDILTEDNATLMISAVSDSLKYVLAGRSRIGAYQNRLEHTINNEENIIENTQAAESQIRDTDMNTEMVKYSNYNVLLQAGQSMLAQANQINQGVLTLLAG